MIAEKQDRAITYIGFDEENNGKFIVNTRGSWVYVNYQGDGFTQVIVGYVVKQSDGRYKAFQLGDKNVKYFDTVNDGVEYIKSLQRSK